MENGINIKLENLLIALDYVIPEIVLSAGLMLVIFFGLFTRGQRSTISFWIALATLLITLIFTFSTWHNSYYGSILFGGMLQLDNAAVIFKALIDIAGILVIIMSVKSDEINRERFNSEYFTLILAAVIGAHLLTMSINFIAVLLSLELLSISTYVLAGYSFTKKGAEGSLKYFLFGSVASAIMLYGFSILYGITGTLHFSSGSFAEHLANNQTPLVLVAGLMTLAGFLYKIAAAPMHPWAPDVYEAAPMPVVAFLSVVPKLAGIVILARFTLAIHLFGQSIFSWQTILGVIAMLSILIGNLSALWQHNPKRMMAYSSIAQTGFLLIGVVCFSNQGIQFMMFYACMYLLGNMAVFSCLQWFEKGGISSIQTFSGLGKVNVMPAIILLLGFISLTGIPPTAGFTAKLFIFTSLWSAYEQTGKDILAWLLVIGLINTVVSLFYYLKIPYYSFIKSGDSIPSAKKTQIENYLALLLVVLILFLFIRPDLLMGWLNRINFVL